MECPNCGTNDVLTKSTGFYVIFGLVLLLLGIPFFLIPVIGMFMGPVSWLLGLGLIILAPFIETEYRCNNCGNDWS